MITTEGSLHIKRYLAGLVPAIADSIAIGVGPKTEAAADGNLQFETERIAVDVVSYDFTTNRLVFKASVPDYYSGVINEIGIFYGPPPFNTKMLTTFDAALEGWSVNTWNSANARIGTEALRLAPATSGSTKATLGSMAFDFSSNAGTDKFLLAFHNLNTNTSSIAIRLQTDDSNYYSATVTNPSAGYNVASIDKSAFTPTGTPSWATITGIEVSVNSKASGASQVDFDGIKIQDQSVRQNYTMISRKVLATPYTKIVGMAQDIEFTMDVNI